MSWDEHFDGYDPELEDEMLGEELNRYWKRGKHKDQNGKVWNIKDMTTFHLKNTIQMFGKIYNVDILLKELKKR